MLISRGAEEMEASEKTRTSKEMQTPWTDSDGTPYNRLTSDRAGVDSWVPAKIIT